MNTTNTVAIEMRYAVEVLNKDTWVEMPGFSGEDYVEAYRGWESINGNPMPARIVEVVSTTTTAETQIWPFEWTEEDGLCRHGGLADHDAHVINGRRGQYCRGNGPFMADESWRPS